MNKAGLKVQAKKYKFTVLELEYISCIIIQEGIKPMHAKVQAILNIKLLKIVKQLQSFLGLVNYY